MNNRKQDAARIRKINTIRATARRITVDELARCNCPTCGRPTDAPYFKTDAHGRGQLGCVDAHHGMALYLGGERSRWFRRPEAQAIRAAELAMIG